MYIRSFHKHKRPLGDVDRKSCRGARGVDCKTWSSSKAFSWWQAFSVLERFLTVASSAQSLPLRNFGEGVLALAHCAIQSVEETDGWMDAFEPPCAMFMLLVA